MEFKKKIPQEKKIPHFSTKRFSQISLVYARIPSLLTVRVYHVSDAKKMALL